MPSPRSQFNSKSPTIKRILREASELSSTPSPDYTATPQEDNLFEWHFTLRGPPGNDVSTGTPSVASTNPSTDRDTTTSTNYKGPYSSGIYHGRIVLPPTYPLRPPSFRFLTPSGRFEVNREICLSISGHHEETWQPAWGLRTALVALRTFMETDAAGQLGGLECSDSQRRRLAHESTTWKCATCNRSNGEIIAACEISAAEKPDAAAANENVPKELKMGWRDEMGNGKKAEVEHCENVLDDGGTNPSFSSSSRSLDSDAEESALAEGFVHTTPPPNQIKISPPPPPSTLSASPSSSPAVRPGQSVPMPTSTTATARPRNGNASAQTGVPPWIDAAIVVVATCLVAVVLRVVLAG